MFLQFQLFLTCREKERSGRGSSSCWLRGSSCPACLRGNTPLIWHTHSQHRLCQNHFQQESHLQLQRKSIYVDNPLSIWQAASFHHHSNVTSWYLGQTKDNEACKLLYCLMTMYWPTDTEHAFTHSEQILGNAGGERLVDRCLRITQHIACRA